MSGAVRTDTVGSEEVRIALAAVLASEVFARSERARALLEHLVHAELSGEAERLKGFSIAMDVFGRDASFDPATDAVVRVQAGRLRDLLEQYYAGDGRRDPVRITIPRGTYVPAYTRCADAPKARLGGLSFDTQIHGDFLKEPKRIETPALAAVALPPAPTGDAAVRGTGASAAADPPPPKKPPPLDPFVVRNIRRFWVAVSLILLLLVFVAWRQTAQEPVQEDVAETTAPRRGVRGALTAAFLPTIEVDIDVAAAGSPPAERLAKRLEAALARFDTVDLILPDAGDDAQKTRSPLTFRFVVGEAAAGEASVMLTHPQSGAVVWGGSVDTTSDEAVMEATVSGLLSETVAPDGAMYAFAASAGIGNALVRCISLTATFYAQQSSDRLREAYDCVDTLATRGAKVAIVHADLASLIMESITDGYGYPVDKTMDDAVRAARLAIGVGPSSAYAWRAYGSVLAADNQSAAAVDAMREAFRLNPYDLRLAASYGYALVYDGKYQEGAQTLRRAVEGLKAHPSWWDYTLFMAALMLEDRGQMAKSASFLIGSDRPHYLAARIVAAHANGNAEAAAALVAELREKRPQFAADPLKTFIESRYPRALAERFAGRLREAGL